jgi:hypothetical protein
VAVGSLALFGLFAMHGWGVHGSGHDAFSSHAAEACGSPAVHHCPTDPAQSPDDHGLMGLCLAVLSGVAALAFTLIARRISPMRDPAEQLRYVFVPPWVRERDPPDLLALGVIRC